MKDDVMKNGAGIPANFDHERPTILLVDDSPANLRLLTGLLMERGYKVRAASSGPMALSVAQTRPVDLILLDIRMPGTDGYEICGRLKNDERTLNIPVIFLSALHETVDKIKGFSIGGVDYITKPFQAEEVIARVQLHLDLRSMRRRLEERNVWLREREELLRLFAEHTPAAVAMCDLGMRYLAFSKRWVEDYGLDGRDLIGRCHYDVFPEIPEHWKREHQRCFAGETIKNREEEFTRNDGGKEWVKREIVPWRNAAGKIGGLIMFTEVITKRKQAELDLVKSKKAAESANLIKSEFLNNMSHEIRTPMNAVIGYTQLLMDEIRDPDHTSYLKNILSGGNALMTLLNDIIELSEIETGKLRVRPTPVDMRSVLNQISQSFSYPFQKKGIELRNEVSGETPEKLLLDEQKIRRILVHLVGNALKFTEKGCVTLRVKTVTKDQTNRECFSGQPPTDRCSLLLEVGDTGIGIPEDLQGHIFENFWQQDTGTTKKYAGTGLGLAITKKLVEMMNGEISVQSETGAGSMFRIVLSDIDICQE